MVIVAAQVIAPYTATCTRRNQMCWKTMCSSAVPLRTTRCNRRSRSQQSAQQSHAIPKTPCHLPRTKHNLEAFRCHWHQKAVTLRGAALASTGKALAKHRQALTATLTEEGVENFSRGTPLTNSSFRVQNDESDDWCNDSARKVIAKHCAMHAECSGRHTVDRFGHDIPLQMATERASRHDTKSI